MKKVKIVGLFSILGVLASGLVHSDQGGTSSNGGGNIFFQPEAHRTWMGIKGIDIAQKVADFGKEHPESVTSCPNDRSLPLMKIPPALADKVEITQRIIWFGILGSRKPQPLDDILVCNRPELYNAYNSLALTLSYDIDVVNHLIKRSNELGGKVKFILKESPTKAQLKGVNARIDEYAMYSPGEKAVLWAARKPCEGFQCIVDRPDYAFLINELTHLVTHRALREKYPRQDTAHDVTELGKREYIDIEGGRYQVNPRYFSKNSEGTAFSEGLSNAVESSVFLIQHLYVRNMDELHKLSDNGCYTSSAVVTPDKRSTVLIENTELERSESIVSSTLVELIRGYEIKVDPTLRSADPYTVYHTRDPQRTKNLIDAVAKYRPTNVKELAAALDRIEGSDRGRRWLREFYFHDYVTGKSTVSELESKKDWAATRYCIRPEQKDQFFSPQLRAEYYLNVAKAEKLLAEKVDREVFFQDISKGLQGFEKRFAAVEKNVKRDVARLSVLKKRMHEKAFCKRMNGDYKNISAFDRDGIVYQTYYEIEKKDGHNRVVPLANIAETMRNICGGSAPSVKQLQEIKGRLQHAEKIRGNVKQVDQDLYQGLLMTWIDLYKKTDRAFEEVEQEDRVFEALDRILPGLSEPVEQQEERPSGNVISIS